MNQRPTPAAGEFYRHFKGNLYQIIGVARHSETGEPMVVYQALYGDYSLYVRPLEMFMSPVDKEKYPEVAQEYRFEKVVPGDSNCENCKNIPMKEESVSTETVAKVAEVMEHSTPEPTPTPQSASADEDQVRTEILQFLDAEGAAEKLEVLRALKKNMDENLITTIELSMDLIPDEKESLERRYELVEQTLEKRVRFEGGRLR